MKRSCPFAPPPEYARLRGEQPIARVSTVGGNTAWVVTRYDDVRKILSDPRVSSDHRHENYPQIMPGLREMRHDVPRSMIGMDAPDHTTARRAVLPEFTVKGLKPLKPRIQQIVDDCVQGMLAAGGPVDLVRALSFPVPARVICELLGIPYADFDFFERCTVVLASRTTTDEERMRTLTDLCGLLDELVTSKEKEPTDDLLGRQIAKRRAEGTLDHDAMVGLAFLLVLAGHETTASMISLGTLALLENPAEIEKIVADPRRIPAAVEEMLRFFTISDIITSRTAMEDIELGDVVIRAGEGVIALGYAANRDPEVFADPDEFDISREARRHMAFGFGAHKCLGKTLARMELAVVFDTLFRRIPGIRLAAPLDEIAFKDEASIYGVHELPVTW
ncbi:cytochrome P450 [Saccharopolyspora shandongensis]|uniref:cytochrome P450 n=1 Tax=Saccharopolyspora shandongensis TaxID=418495 RepID=UPI0033D1E6AB